MAEEGNRSVRRAHALLVRHGGDATAFAALGPGLEHWFDGDGCVAYADTGSAWVAATAPIAAAEAQADLGARFVAAAKRKGRRACFFAVDEAFSTRAGLGALHVGDEPVWDPGRWEESVRASRRLRAQIRAAKTRGVTARALDAARAADRSAPERRALERMVARWLGARRMAPLGFVSEVAPFGFAAERRYWVAETGGALRGMLAAAPAHGHGGWFLEHLLRDPLAPTGTLDLLVDAAMRALGAEGCRLVTFGLTPLRAPRSGVLRWVRALARPFYDFAGLGVFKRRLRPQRWEPRFLAWPRPLPAAAALYDALTAFARGSLLRFGARTLLHAARRSLRAPPGRAHDEAQDPLRRFEELQARLLAGLREFTRGEQPRLRGTKD